MLSSLRPLPRLRTPLLTNALPTLCGHRSISKAAAIKKAAGDIFSVFPSLSGAATAPLPPRFAELKTRLIWGHEDRLQGSWQRLLTELRKDIEVLRALGPAVVPKIAVGDIDNEAERAQFCKEFRERGVAVVTGVVSEKEALDWKELVQRYVRSNPQTKGFPAHNPAVYELYWSPSQILARAHPNLLRTQSFLMSHWHSHEPAALISTAHPTTYADRVRIRQPGDAGFALGPHVDGGSCERWEDRGYGRGRVYQEIFQGRWEEYDPWESSCRLPVISDLYNGAGACSMFRMFQGWLSMSTTGPGEGTLMVNPLLGKATAYYLLRPFFEPRKAPGEAYGSAFLDADNWKMEKETTSMLHGATPSHCQELDTVLHPHLSLEDSMVHVPQVNPGDYVVWHCDTIHAVDKIHAGPGDASVMYIPACPLTEANAEYLIRQREAFAEGIPAPDFPSGEGESRHLGRLTPDYVMQNIDVDAQRAMGVSRWDEHVEVKTLGEARLLQRANEILGF
ncbi:MAG: hypothetical protein FRX48_01904 [Lasallia pustulata]|uniref:DUF1479-domain-containing protein n=1 Tax=Lasallia pustulata TaxID=136370 RepID=A0A5M8PZF3_9LECA|nr:MAG: hypothetical protein FRX48_01904 [Lasallia pustulata]